MLTRPLGFRRLSDIHGPPWPAKAPDTDSPHWPIPHQSSDSEVRKQLWRPQMRTSESKELQHLVDLSSGFEFEFLSRTCRDTDRTFKFATLVNLPSLAI